LGESTEIAKKDLMEMLTRTSAFSTTDRLEGVYVRFEDEKRSKTLDRGKIVRGDFIVGNEHWSKGRINFNGILENLN
jgi:atypical dual specificity phosphatase